MQDLYRAKIETPKVRYSINRENWEKAQAYFETFFAECKTTNECC